MYNNLILKAQPYGLTSYLIKYKSPIITPCCQPSVSTYTHVELYSGSITTPTATYWILRRPVSAHVAKEGLAESEKWGRRSTWSTARHLIPVTTFPINSLTLCILTQMLIFTLHARHMLYLYLRVLSNWSTSGVFYIKCLTNPTGFVLSQVLEKVFSVECPCTHLCIYQNVSNHIYQPNAIYAKRLPSNPRRKFKKTQWEQIGKIWGYNSQALRDRVMSLLFNVKLGVTSNFTFEGLLGLTCFMYSFLH